MTANELTTRRFEFKNAELNEISGKIHAHVTVSEETARINFIEIAKLLAHIDAHKLAESDGFKSTADYAMETFNWKKTNAYNLIKVGQALTAGRLPEGNYTVNQYVELLALPTETINEAVKSGEISEEMTTKELREKAAELKPKKETSRKEPMYFWYIGGHHDIAATVAAKFTEMQDWYGGEGEFAKTKLGDVDIYVWKSETGYFVIERGDKVTETTLTEYLNAKKQFELELTETSEIGDTLPVEE